MSRYINKKEMSWFDITKYDDASKMTITDWANALSFRYITYHTYDDFHENIDIKGLLNQIFEKPIHLSNNPNPIMKGVIGSEKSIYDITILDAYYHYKEIINSPSFVDAKIECEKRDEIFKIFDDDALFEEDKKLNWGLLNSSIIDYRKRNNCSNDTYELIRVDMSFSDDLIINDLKLWLENKRKKSFQIKKSFQKSDFENWTKLRILALIDLDFYSKVYNVQFTNHLLGDLLFPDEEVDVAEKIRKTVRPLVNNVFQNKLLNLLSNQANAESERN